MQLYIFSRNCSQVTFTDFVAWFLRQGVLCSVCKIPSIKEFFSTLVCKKFKIKICVSLQHYSYRYRALKLSIFNHLHIAEAPKGL